MSERRKFSSGPVTREFIWYGFSIRITRKKVRNINLRIRPDEPQVIHISIPRSMTCEAAVKLLDQSRIRNWAENYQKRIYDTSVPSQLQNTGQLQHVTHYRKKLNEILPDLIRKWERILGVKCNKVTVRDTRSQWGSCSIRTKNISISLWLGAFPEECIEYVVVHELAHLLEAGHNERFYGILDQHYPIWKSCREQLKHGLT